MIIGILGSTTTIFEKLITFVLCLKITILNIEEAKYI